MRPVINGKRKHIAARTRDECNQKLDRALRQRDLLSNLDGGDMTLREWFWTWHDTKTRRVAVRTAQAYRSDWSHIDPVLGDMSIASIRPEHIEALYDAILAKPGCGTSVVAHARGTLSACLTEAVRRDRLVKNPVSAAIMPHYDAAEVESFTLDEVRTILAATKDQTGSSRWAFGLVLGLRQSEVLGLKWSDIDWDTGTIMVRRQIQRHPWRHGCVPSDRDNPQCAARTAALRA